MLRLRVSREKIRGGPRATTRECERREQQNDEETNDHHNQERQRLNAALLPYFSR